MSDSEDSTSEEHDDSDDDDDDDLSVSVAAARSVAAWPKVFKTRGVYGPFDRTKNYRYVSEPEEHNIPSISFCNTPEDPWGRFLASTNIVGSTRVYDLSRESNNVIRKSGHGGSFGWNIQWIDKRAFRRTQDPMTALQYAILLRGEKQLHKDKQHPEDCLVDISVTKSLVRESGRWIAGDQDPGIAASNASYGQASHTSANTDDLAQGADLLVPSNDLDGDSDHDSGDTHSVQDQIDQIDPVPAHGHQATSHAISWVVDLQPAEGNPVRATHVTLNPAQWFRDLTDKSVWPRDAVHASESSCAPVVSPEYDKIEGFSSSRSFPDREPDSPILLSTRHALQLIQSSGSLDPDRSNVSPSIFILDPVEQAMHGELSRQLNGISKINLVVPIPELGILLAGSSVGRVAIFSLHTLWPNPFVGDGKNPRTEVRTMRLDHIIPFESQEHKWQRPLVELAGVAASPVQGHSAKSGSDGAGVGGNKKYRVMLLYREETILTYEIWRDPKLSTLNSTTARNSSAQPMMGDLIVA